MSNQNNTAMQNAVIEYGKELSVSALVIAEKYGVPVEELHKEFAAHKAIVSQANDK